MFVCMSGSRLCCHLDPSLAGHWQGLSLHFSFTLTNEWTSSFVLSLLYDLNLITWLNAFGVFILVFFLKRLGILPVPLLESCSVLDLYILTHELTMAPNHPPCQVQTHSSDTLIAILPADQVLVHLLFPFHTSLVNHLAQLPLTVLPWTAVYGSFPPSGLIHEAMSSLERKPDSGY